MSLASIVDKLISFIGTLIPVLSSLAVMLFIFGVFNYLFSNIEGKHAKSKMTMFWGIIALFVLFSIWGILGVVKRSLLQ